MFPVRAIYVYWITVSRGCLSKETVPYNSAHFKGFPFYSEMWWVIFFRRSMILLQTLLKKHITPTQRQVLLCNKLLSGCSFKLDQQPMCLKCSNLNTRCSCWNGMLKFWCPTFSSVDSGVGAGQLNDSHNYFAAPKTSFWNSHYKSHVQPVSSQRSDLAGIYETCKISCFSGAALWLPALCSARDVRSRLLYVLFREKAGICSHSDAVDHNFREREHKRSVDLSCSGGQIPTFYFNGN